jgi:TetR/AcrR family transcriptional regulator, cholesterol catabolism regulator
MGNAKKTSTTIEPRQQQRGLSADASTRPSSADLRPREKQILDVAADFFARLGFEETSMREIADVVGMRKPSLYHYFGCKEDILWALLETGLNDQFEAATAILDSSTSGDGPRARMRALLDAHANHVDERMDQVRIFLRSYDALGPERTEKYVNLRNQYVQLFIDLVAEGQETGDFPLGDPKIVAYGILGMYNWMVEWYRTDASYTARDIHRIWMDTVLHGITADSQR